MSTKDQWLDLAEQSPKVIEYVEQSDLPAWWGKYSSGISGVEWASLGPERRWSFQSVNRSTRLHRWFLVITRGKGFLLHFIEQFIQFSDFLRTHLLRMFDMTIEIFRCRGVNPIAHLQQRWRIENPPAYLHSMTGEQCFFRVQCCCLVTQLAGIHYFVLMQEIERLERETMLGEEWRCSAVVTARCVYFLNGSISLFRWSFSSFHWLCMSSRRLAVMCSASLFY